MGLMIDPMEDTFLRRLYEKGLTEGEEKGLEKGEARFLLLTLRQKFGPVPDSVDARIGSATSTQLEAWMKRALTATSLDNLLD